MSRLATVRELEAMGDPFIGGLFKTFGKMAVGGIKKLVKKKIPQLPAGLPPIAQLPSAAAGIFRKSGKYLGPAAAGAAIAGTAGAIGGRLMAPGFAAPRRRGRGITARELRGFRKVARLLHSMGMVPRRFSRGRKKICCT